MKRSIQDNNIDHLKKAIEECETASYPELAAQLRVAREKLSSLTGIQGETKKPDPLIEELRRAIAQRQKPKLEKVLDRCVATGLPQLDQYIKAARKSLTSLPDERPGWFFVK